MKAFDKVKNSRVGKILYNDAVEGEALRNVTNMAKRTANYFKEHPKKAIADTIGLVFFGTTLTSDAVALYDKPPKVLERIFLEGQKPKGMSILPPSNYYFNPPGGSREPLSGTDILSLVYPSAYLIFQGARLGLNYYKSRKKEKS